MRKKQIFILFLIITLCSANLVFASEIIENEDIRIIGLDNINILSTSWDNPNAWSLEDEVDIVKVISTELNNQKGKKIKSSTINTELTIHVHIPEAYRDGYSDSDYSIVVFDGTDVRDHIETVKDGDWLIFNWNTVEDFGVVVRGATDGEAGVLTLVGQSRKTIEAVDFPRLFRILGVIAAVCIPFMTIYSWRRVKKEMLEEAEAMQRKEEEERL